MQDSGRPSGGADLRRAVNAIRDNPHDMLAEALRAGTAVREIRDARALGRLRTDLAAIRAGQTGRIAVADGGSARRRERLGAALADPRAAAAAERGWQDSLAARLPVQLLAELALSGGLGVALVMFWNTFGRAFVTAIAGQPVP